MDILFNIVLIATVLGVVGWIVSKAFGGTKRTGSGGRKSTIGLTPALAVYQSKVANLPNNDRIIGIPAYGLVAKYGDKGVSGEKSEISTALKLASLTSSFEGVYVLNNVQFTPKWDIDHVVVSGKTIILIDTKNWQNEMSYSLTRGEKDKPTALKNGAMFPGNSLSMEYYLKTVRSMFPSYNVYGMMNIDARNASLGSDAGFGFSFVRSDDLVNIIKNVLSQDSSSNVLPSSKTKKTVGILAAKTHN